MPAGERERMRGYAGSYDASAAVGCGVFVMRGATGIATVLSRANRISRDHARGDQAHVAMRPPRGQLRRGQPVVARGHL
jgi:hypothetical protein